MLESEDCFGSSGYLVRLTKHAAPMPRRSSLLLVGLAAGALPHAAAEESSCPLPAPSLTCGATISTLKGWCMEDAPGLSNYANVSDAGCCALCAKTANCIAWNTNTGQRSCHLRGGVGTPNKSPLCNLGVVRPSPPPPPPPPKPKPAPKGAKNLLVIVCDDFRPFIKPWTGRYGIEAPNLEKLASQSMVFNNTYVQQAVCGPSRNSFLTGKRPDSTNVWTFKTNFRRSGMDTAGQHGADWVTMPGIFKLNGWNTLGMGKVFHPGSPPENDCAHPHPQRPGMQEDCRSWSTEFTTDAPADITAIGDIPTQITRCDGVTQPNTDSAVAATCNFSYFQPDAQIGNCAFNMGTPKAFTPTCCDLPDENCTDLWLADAAVRTLHTVTADKTKPFALFVGFHKPHPFWDVPQRFQDKYIDTLPLPTHLDAPSDLPDVAYYSCTSVNGRSDVGGHNCTNYNMNAHYFWIFC